MSAHENTREHSRTDWDRPFIFLENTGDLAEPLVPRVEFLSKVVVLVITMLTNQQNSIYSQSITTAAQRSLDRVE